MESLLIRHLIRRKKLYFLLITLSLLSLKPLKVIKIPSECHKWNYLESNFARLFDLLSSELHHCVVCGGHDSSMEPSIVYETSASSSTTSGDGFFSSDLLVKGDVTGRDVVM